MLSAHAWRDLLTVSLPASLFTGPAVVPYLSGIITACIATSIAVRSWRHMWALAPAAVFLAVGILWGTHIAPLAVEQGAAFGGVALGWLAWRARRAQRDVSADILGFQTETRARRLPVLSMAGMLGAAMIVGLGLTVLAGQPNRFVLRDTVEPPLDLRQFASPLTGFRYLERDQRDEVLMTVSGMPHGARLRLATVDTYDGVVYNVEQASSAYRRVGSTIGEEIQLPGTPTTVGVTVAKYAGVWLPGSGDLRGVRFSGSAAEALSDTLYYNRTSGTAVVTAGVSEGTAYEVDVVLPAVVTDADLDNRAFATVALPSNSGVPEAVGASAAELVGAAATPRDQVRTLAAKLREVGFFSDGSDGRSRSGHTAERITALLTAPQIVGDDEQYAVAMALMARQLGVPARVVMGFYPDANAAASGDWQVRGSDAHVWVEVAFDGVGWVAFDPTPDRSKTPQTDVPQPRHDPKPQVLPPPDPPVDRNNAANDIVDDQRKPPVTDEPAWRRLMLLTVVGVVSLAVLLGPLVLIVALKRRRRERRKESPVMSERSSGGWLEIVDHATDLGARIDPTLTRRELSGQFEESYPGAGALVVAELADAGVFGPAEPAEADVEAMWREVDVVLGRMDTSVSRRRRFLARVSPRSLGLSRQALSRSLSSWRIPEGVRGRAHVITRSLRTRVAGRKKDHL